MALPRDIIESRTRRSFLGALLAFPAAALAVKSCVPEPVAGYPWKEQALGCGGIPTVTVRVDRRGTQPTGEWETRLRYSIDDTGTVYLYEYEQARRGDAFPL